MSYPKKIVINKKTFEFIGERRKVRMAVYQEKRSILRLGTHSSITRELAIVRELKKYNFPLPKLLKTGRQNNQSFYIEQSLGPMFFSGLFAADVKEHGKISDFRFRQFLSISTKFAKAQLKTISKNHQRNDLALASHLKYIKQELPRYKHKIQALFERAKNNLAIYPLVLSHGDFTSHNLFPKGVIDLEDLFLLPAGYDLVSAIFTIEFFPDSPWYEYYRKYTFTPGQKQKYLQTFDRLYQTAGLPKISDNLFWFEFCRAMWLTAKNEGNPRLAKFRYKLFIKKYLNGGAHVPKLH